MPLYHVNVLQYDVLNSKKYLKFHILEVNEVIFNQSDTDKIKLI